MFTLEKTSNEEQVPIDLGFIGSSVLEYITHIVVSLI